jgi:hypothetical protein
MNRQAVGMGLGRCSLCAHLEERTSTSCTGA